jgi:hypothetical protein
MLWRDIVAGIQHAKALFEEYCSSLIKTTKFSLIHMFSYGEFIM